MSELLVVDDDSVDRMLIWRALGSIEDASVQFAEDGEDALKKCEASEFDLVITDLRMPRLDGIELVRAVRKIDKRVPVMIVTSAGSEEIAIEALRAGAADYVDKNELASELVSSCDRLLGLNHEKKELAATRQFATSGQTHFTIPSDRSLAPRLARLMQKMTVEAIGNAEEHPTQVGVALEEALLNAIVHGNLEVSSQLRELGDGSFEKLITERQFTSPYAERVVDITFSWRSNEVEFVIRDQGPGFDPSSLPDPEDPCNLLKPSGRGVLLMRTFMDEVEYNEVGNEVRLSRKYQSKPASVAPPHLASMLHDASAAVSS